MTWPYLTPQVVELPNAQDLGQNEQPKEKILQISTSNNEGQPYAVLTNVSLYLYDQTSNSAIAVHKRSDASIEKHGSNLKFKRNHDDSSLVVQTDKSYLLVYAILKPMNTNNDSELLSVYHQNTGNLLQNGLVTEKQTQFFQYAEVESPIWKFQLRFKLFLKVSSGVIDYQPLSKFELLLITNASAQLLNLENDDNKQLDLGLGEVSVKTIIHSAETPDLFIFKLTNDKVAFYQRQALDKFEKFNESLYFQGCENGAINESFKLVVFISESNKLVYYNYDIHQKIKEKDFSSFGSIKNISWNGDGESLTVLLEDGHWLLLSTFGAITFNSQDHGIKSPWLESIISLNITYSGNQLVLTDGDNVYSVQLLKQPYLQKQTNHNVKRPILLNGAHIHIYTGHEMNTSSINKPINWNIVKIPFEQYHQIPNIEHVSISQDAKYLAVANRKALLVHSFGDNEWSFYINDYNTDLNIGQLNWFETFNLLILTNKTKTNSELIIFDFRRFKTQETFNSDSVIFKYDFGADIQLLNSFGKDMIVYTVNDKFYHFKIETVGVSFKIDLIRILSLDEIFPNNQNQNFRSITKVSSKSDEDNDLLILNNGELLYLKYRDDNKFVKNLLLDKIEYVHKINDEEYYLYNGESFFLIKSLSQLLETRDPSKAILKIDVEHYPILLVLEKGLYVTLENSLSQRKTIELNSVISKNSIFLHDLIRFELQTHDETMVFHKYNRYKNFQYSLELLLYQTIVNDQDLTKISKLLKISPNYELNIVSKCLRKIETEFWSKLFKELKTTPQELLDSSIELKQFKTLGIWITIFLNYEKDDDEKSVNGKNEKGDLKIDEAQIIKILKLIFENAQNDDELWETGFELIRFLKLLDSSGALLQKGLDELKKMK